MVTERSITRAILAYLNTLQGAHAIKIHADKMQGAGHPDIIATHKGQTIIIEVKTPTGRLRTLQEYELDKWRRAGALVIVARSLKDVVAQVERGSVDE